MPEKYRLCIFDFDGTVVDSMGHIADVAVEMMTECYDISEKEAREKFVKTSGIPFFRQLEVLFPSDSRNKEVAQKFEDKKQFYFLDEPLYPDTRLILEHLKNWGYISAVSSSNLQEIIDKYLKQKNVEFDEVLGFRKGFEKGKAHFDFLKEKYALKKSEMLFVGDSLNDARRASEYGIDFIGRIGTFSEEDFAPMNIKGIVPHLLELKKWFPTKE